VFVKDDPWYPNTSVNGPVRFVEDCNIAALFHVMTIFPLLIEMNSEPKDVANAKLS